MSTESTRPKFASQSVPGHLFLERVGNTERWARNANGEREQQNLLVLMGSDISGERIEIITKNEAQRAKIDALLAKKIAAGTDIAEAEIVISFNARQITYLGDDDEPTGKVEHFLDEGNFVGGADLMNLQRVLAANKAAIAARDFAMNGDHEAALKSALAFIEQFTSIPPVVVEWPAITSAVEVEADNPEARAAVRLQMADRSKSAVARLCPVAAGNAIIAAEQDARQSTAAQPVATTDEPVATPVVEPDEEEEMEMSMGGSLGGML